MANSLASDYTSIGVNLEGGEKFGGSESGRNKMEDACLTQVSGKMFAANENNVKLSKIGRSLLAEYSRQQGGIRGDFRIKGGHISESNELGPAKICELVWNEVAVYFTNLQLST